MTQTVPATCVLGPGKTGLTIGLRVLNLDGTTYAAFATTNVAETSIAGTYRKAGGVVVPAAGGYIVWGEAATDYAEATIGGSVAAELSNSSDCTASGAISRTRGNTWIINATVGAITGYTSLWLTIKHSRGGPDSDAILQVKLNASGVGDGLLYVNGTPASDSTKAAITVNNAATGAITITVHEVITAALPVGEFAYDIQTLVSGVVATPDSGAFTVTADVTRSIV